MLCLKIDAKISATYKSRKTLRTNDIRILFCRDFFFWRHRNGVRCISCTFSYPFCNDLSYRILIVCIYFLNLTNYRLTEYGFKITIDNDRDVCIMMLILFDDFSEARRDNSSPQSCILLWGSRYHNVACILIDFEKLDSAAIYTKL